MTAAAAPLTPVVELLRVSTEAQAMEDRAGLAAQHTANLRTCASYGLEVVERLEIVESGAEVARGPAMARLLGWVGEGRVEGIVLAEFSRLFRPDNWHDWGILQVLAEAGAKIYEPGGPIDLETDHGAAMAGMKGVFAGWERKQIRGRLERGKNEHRKRGEHVDGAAIPRGLAYSRETGYHYIRGEAEGVAEMFAALLRGESLRQIALEHGLGVTAVGYVLRNEFYATAERVTSMRNARRLGRAVRIPRRPEDVVRVKLPLKPLVSRDDFDAVQLILDRRRNEGLRIRSEAQSRFLYRGLVRCDRDESRMYTKMVGTSGRHRHRRPIYYCTHRVDGHPCPTGNMTAGKLEAAIDRAVVDLLADAGTVATAVEAHAAALSARLVPAVDAAAIEAEVARLGSRRERVLAAFFDGDIAPDRKNRELREVDAKLAALKAARRPVAASPVVSASVLAEELAGLFAEWEFLGTADRRRILESVTPRFYVAREGRGEFSVRGVLFPLAFGSDSDARL